MSLSTFAKNKILDYLLKGIAFTVNPVYVSLHTATPGLTGASEVSGGSYARQAANAANWTAAAAGESSNVNSISYSGITVGVHITHMGLWDAVSGGNFIIGGALDVARTVIADETDVFVPGSLIAEIL